jgi:hypothetical protein
MQRQRSRTDYPRDNRWSDELIAYPSRDHSDCLIGSPCDAISVSILFHDANRPSN